LWSRDTHLCTVKFLWKLSRILCVTSKDDTHFKNH
jgi:hypothetical protein